MTGLRVILWHPEWEVSCRACQHYLITPDGTPQRNPQTGELLPRGVLETPCDSCPKVPTWAKSAGKEISELRRLAHDLSPANRRAWHRYREWRAVGRFPADPVVTWYAGLILGVEQEVAGGRADRSYHASRDAVETLVDLLLRVRR